MTAINKADVVIFGGTAPGIVAAIRAAREGLTVRLITPGAKLGGALPSLGALETHYQGVRSPLLKELADKLRGYYLNTYGEDSSQYHACQSGMMLTFEPHVMERLLIDWINAESRIRVHTRTQLLAIHRKDGRVVSVQASDMASGRKFKLEGRYFVEASYEGDLMAMAGASHRIGRESRKEFDEPSAGTVFTRWIQGEFPGAAANGRLNLVTAKATTTDPLPESTGEGDDNIQSYSFRLCITDDPSNRRLLDSPPSGYDRAIYAPLLLTPKEKECLILPFHHRFLIYSLSEMIERDHIFHGHALPNRKRSWNATNFVGAGKGYAEANEEGRRRIEAAHMKHALGLMWFLQNDSAVPDNARLMAREWGLARDEFADNHNLPPQIYIREARRLLGRSIYTEHDSLLARGSNRTPVHFDSIAITEFSLDSLACTPRRLPGTGALCDGQLFQMEVSRPGQVPFGTLLPREIDNLIVVTTVSATHVGWGTIRQTPTLMHLAESAAWAIVLAGESECALQDVSVPELQRLLVRNGVMISFFNDFDMDLKEPWVPAVQFAAARGFFSDYDARANQPLSRTTESMWRMLGMESRHLLDGSGVPVTRGTACERWFGNNPSPKPEFETVPVNSKEP
ncbi:MAG: FAD-dependent oxidoreductase [Opitutaceae bacterium]|nr:FAD-dependent oxidoreductase [Opitutaceae bacterium]